MKKRVVALYFAVITVLCMSHTCARATEYQERHINRQSMLNGAGAEIVVKELLI